jgi:YesN/AraC family two-component response regulator
MADQFYLSQNYIGSYFKRNVGTTLSDYIGKYRYKLIKQRLRYSQDSINEIAMDFGFFDASHLYKFFKKHSGESPTDYRMELSGNKTAK